jgi:hypothetical protein
MDLDFYCHRPFRCLLKRVHKFVQLQHTDTVVRRTLEDGLIGNSTYKQAAPVEAGPLPTDILAVSREPLAHAVLFRNKTRVIIQVR